MNQKVYTGRVVTKSVPKIDALSLAMGKPMFTDDKEFRNLVHVKMLWSPHALADIISIDTNLLEKNGFTTPRKGYLAYYQANGKSNHYDCHQ